MFGLATPFQRRSQNRFFICFMHHKKSPSVKIRNYAQRVAIYHPRIDCMSSDPCSSHPVLVYDSVIYLLRFANIQNNCIWGGENPREAELHELDCGKATFWSAVDTDGVVSPSHLNKRLLRGVDYYQMLDHYCQSYVQKFCRMLFLSRMELLLIFYELSALHWINCSHIYGLEDMVQQVDHQDLPSTSTVHFSLGIREELHVPDLLA